jgi:hypothetical protein
VPLPGLNRQFLDFEKRFAEIDGYAGHQVKLASRRPRMTFERRRSKKSRPRCGREWVVLVSFHLEQ